MIFALEALDARHGDSLIVHYGTQADPRFILIDGGPSGVFKDRLSPRLEELGQVRANQPPKLDLLMISHIDDDHIKGVLDLTRKLRQLKQDGDALTADVCNLWHNSFDDIVGKPEDDAVPARVASAMSGRLDPGDLNLDRSSGAMLASVPQGRQLRKDAVFLGWRVNQTGDVMSSVPAPPGDLIALPTDGQLQAQFNDGLLLRILGPSQQRIDDLQDKWDEELEKLGLDEQAAEAGVAALLDTSVRNLASIIAMVECDGKRMLLTGDARADDITSGLEAAGVLTGETVHVDLLKLPHHGSARNIDEDFFQRVTADHYVISANGLHDNPDIETLELLTAARGQAKYTIHFTNHDGHGGLAAKLDEFFGEDGQENTRRYELNYRLANALSIMIELGSEQSVG